MDDASRRSVSTFPHERGAGATDDASAAIAESVQPVRSFDTDSEVTHEQLRLTAGGLVGGGAVHMVLAAIVLAVLWGEAATAPLLGWTGLLAASAIIRMETSAWLLRRRCEDSAVTRYLLVATGILVGAAWGLLPVLFFPSLEIPQQVLITFVIGGVAIGALPVSAYYPPSFYALVLPALTPLIVLHFSQGSDLHVGMAAMLAVFWTSVLVFGRRFGETLRQMIRLQVGRGRLLDQLKETQETLEAALKSRRDSFAIFDSRDRLVLWNDVFAQRFESRSPPLRPGTSFADIIEVGAWRRRDPQTGEPDHAWAARRMARHHNPQGAFEEKVGDRWLLVQEFKTQSGHTVIVHTNISDLKLREHALRDSEAQKAGIVGAALDGIITLGESGLVLEFNAAAAAIFGWPAKDVLGRPIQETLLAPRYRHEFSERIASFLETGTSPLLGRRSEMAAYRRDGRECPVEVSVIRVDTAHGAVFTAFVRDISERLEAARRLTVARDEAEAASRAKSTFLATIGHEIRTPMTGVLGALELLMDTPLSEEQLCMARTALGAGEALRGLLDDLLDYTRIEAGRLELSDEVFSPRCVVESSMDILRRQAEEKDLALFSEFGEDVPAAVRGDSDRLRQILLNLIGNALKYTDTGSVRVCVIRCGGTADTPLLRFSVIDTGQGIPQDFRGALFAKFTQADPVGMRATGGAGLGLAIVKGLAELMGGSAGFASELGKGSNFWCDLPLKLADAAKFVRPPAADGGVGVDLSGLAILLVDDSEINRRVTREMLRRAGAAVTEAASGSNALEKANTGHWDLVVMDISMPGMDGVETTWRLRDLWSNPPPVIALTAHAGTESRRRFLSLGFAGYLPKPVRRSQLLGLAAELSGRGGANGEEAGGANATRAGGSHDVLDKAVLQALEADVGSATMGRLVTRFLNECEDRRRAAEIALESNDRNEIALHAHALKSAARSFGAHTFAGQAERLETLAENASLAKLETACDSMFEAYLEARRQLEERAAAQATAAAK